MSTATFTLGNDRTRMFLDTWYERIRCRTYQPVRTTFLNQTSQNRKEPHTNRWNAHSSYCKRTCLSGYKSQNEGIEIITAIIYMDQLARACENPMLAYTEYIHISFDCVLCCPLEEKVVGSNCATAF